VILLDTNVLSVLMREEGDPGVVAWLNRQPPESMWTTAITVFEVRVGLEILESGRRRRFLEAAFDKVLSEDFDDRVVPFDESAAQAAGRIAAVRRKLGRSLEVRDVQIAGIAIARKAKIATRNIRHFEGLGIDLINPWSA
jgi:predicted nucleic acid-binding protein